jgi:hypothetical protein
MSISITCSCGARLEIDAKFGGQTIACPDCHKSLTVTPPPPPARRTSGLAVASLLLAVIGAFTVVGTLAAMALGAIAYRRIPKQPGVTGQDYAKAGIILGGVFTVLAVLAYSTSNLLGVDGFLRQYVWSGKLKFPPELLVAKPDPSLRVYSLQRPSQRWGVLDPLPVTGKNSDRAMFVNLRDDAHVLWLHDTVHPEDDAFSLRARAVQVFSTSDLVQMIGRLTAEPETLKERDVHEDGRAQEFLLDAVLGGIERTFLFQLKPEGDRLNVLVGGARKQRFERLQPVLRQTLESFKPEVSR